MNFADRFPVATRPPPLAEAELGERIMRALTPRRVGLLETGAGRPIIVGRADNADVLRCGFSPSQRSSASNNPETNDEAKAPIRPLPLLG